MRRFRLWILFICSAAAIFIINFLFTSGLLYLSVRSGLLPTRGPVPWIPLASLIGSAVCISFLLTMIMSRSFFTPIHKLILAIDRVAHGDFTVQLPEHARWKDIREMNLDFNRMVKGLASIETLQSDFIQNVSHEIKTPLATMEGYASLLTSTELSREQRQHVDRILSGARQLTSLTSNILMLSKLENQPAFPVKRSFSLDEQLRQCILATETLWSKKELELDIDLPEIGYHGNEELLAQIWINLLSNAIKFTPPGGQVSVHLTSTDDGYAVIFRDTGIGMDENVMAHIFDRFYQGDASRSSAGNGLGLALVKRMLPLCDAAITVESTPGKGSVFTVWLSKNQASFGR